MPDLHDLSWLPDEELQKWVVEQRWFASKSREVTQLNVVESVPLRSESPLLVLTLMEAVFAAGTHETYQVPLGLRPEGDGWFPGWRLIVTTSFGRVQVLSVHLHPPVSEGGSFVAGYFTTSGVRRAELERFLAHLDPALPTLIVGDFNEKDGQAVRFLAGRGFRSALPEFKPEASTWQWPTSMMTLRDRLDHIAYDPRLEPLSADVLYQGRSDHFPVISVLAPARPPTH